LGLVPATCQEPSEAVAQASLFLSQLLRLSYTTGFSDSPACRWPIMVPLASVTIWANPIVTPLFMYTIYWVSFSGEPWRTQGILTFMDMKEERSDVRSTWGLWCLAPGISQVLWLRSEERAIM
jgi:uncharacterized membrane protein